MEFTEIQNLLDQAREQREKSEKELFKLKEKLKKMRREKSHLSRFAGKQKTKRDIRLSELKDHESELTSTIDKLSKTLIQNKKIELERFESFLPFTDPIENISEFDDRYPILLVPLRIETRFKLIEGVGGVTQHQLWVRVFPDDISIDTFEELPSENEIRNARSYWSLIWRAGDFEEDQRAAWRILVSSHGSGRAYWIINTYRPVNPSEQPERKTNEKMNLVISTDDPPTSNEKLVLQTFWSAMWLAQEDRAKQTAAWNRMVHDVGETRAQELRAKYIPFNFSDTPVPPLTHEDVILEVAFIEFPKADETDTKFQAWSQAPKVNILPERLVLLGFIESNKDPVIKVIGEPIPSPLITGPDPSAEEGKQLRTEAGEIIVSDEIKWMVDFDEAVAKGMGFKVDLTPEQAENGFNRLFVLGVRLSEDLEKAKTSIENLIDHHQHSRKGFSILLQGTPTNNTEKETSAYSWREDPDDSFDIFFRKEIPDDPEGWLEKTDGRWLAEILGIDTKYVANVNNYYGTDQCESKSMNVALWPATLGYFMETMMAPVFSENIIDQTKSFFQRFVSGRGMIPAIRVGDQPYGILPTTAFSRMKWLRVRTPLTHTAFTSAYAGSNLSYLQALYTVLRLFDRDWSMLLDKVSHVGKTGDAHQILLDIVGLHPSSVEYYYRHAQSFVHIYNTLNLRGLGGKLIASRITENYLRSGMDLLAEFGYTGVKDEEIPDILKKFFFGRSDLLKGPLIDDVPLSESAQIRFYTEDNRNYIQWLIDATNDSHDTLRKQNGFTGDKPPNALLYLMLHHALDLGYLDASLRLHLTSGVFDRQQVNAAMKELEFIHVKDAERDTASRWQYLYKVEPRITSDETILVQDYIATILGDRPETGTLRAQLNALEHLKNVSTAALERVFSEHLDLCSYRLDAWQLALVNVQLSIMRGIQFDEEGGSEQTQGLYIGAYGWLEDVKSENKTLRPADIDPELAEIFDDPKHPLMIDNTNGGYIHAPSTNHAVSAGVLRNGYLANATEFNPGSLAVNLSSERVRKALSIIDGIRSGQSLAALLGYQLERGMHDRHDVEVDEFIFDLRKAFPLRANQMSNTKVDDLDQIQKIEARNVIDGAALIDQIKRSGEKTYPFGRNDLPTASFEQRHAINEEVDRILDINDAVADLAIAEGVHQAVQGNYDRAAATLDTYSKGSFPPIPDVVKTPHSGVTLTHRVGLQLQSGLDPEDLGNITPRSKAEPAINKWLSNMLPSMDDIVCVIEYYDHDMSTSRSEVISMDDLALLPIDIVFITQMESEQAMTALDDAIILFAIQKFGPRADVKIEIKYTKQPDDDSKLTLFELAPLLNSLRTLIQQCRPLTPADVKLPVENKKDNEGDVSLNPKKITLVRDALDECNIQLRTFIDTISTVVEAKDLENIILNIDKYINEIANLFKEISQFGLPQTGIGFILEWKRQTVELLRNKIEELIARWNKKLTEFNELIADYDALPPTATDEERFALLQKAELKISSTATVPLAGTPDDYKDNLVNERKVAFLSKLNDIKDILSGVTLSDLYSNIASVTVDILNYDLIGLDIENQKNELLTFAEQVLQRSRNLQTDLDKRLQQVSDHLKDYEDAADSRKKVAVLLEAGKVLLGEDFRIVPEFKVTEEQADEWQNAYDNRDRLLEYQKDSLKEEFPVDNWLYGIARVREKMHHVENMAILVDSLLQKELKLEPIQFPYHEEDHWLAMEYPQKKTDDTEFKIDEDKLIYTSYYSRPFDKTKTQCGLLLDEWTEVIPAEKETTGLTFHYDRPNSEPPQTLLLVTPSEFKQSWQWDDVVDSLHETLEMAKKRAIEPSHIDTTIYARFLPALVSAATVFPITLTLNLALNNKFYEAAKNG